MKALSVKQPWANLIANGEKTLEIRDWTTPYRGEIIICSSKSPNIYPTGVQLCSVELYDIQPMKPEDTQKAQFPYKKNLYSWYIRNVKQFKNLKPIKGTLGLFDI